MEIYNIMNLYVFLYKISFFLFGFFLCSCISYIDRAHAREKTRYIGCLVHKVITESRYIMLRTIYNESRYIVLRPLCVLSECITGFIEGIENCDPIYKISYVQHEDKIIEPENIENKSEDKPNDIIIETFANDKQEKVITLELPKKNDVIIEQNIIEKDNIIETPKNEVEYINTETTEKKQNITLVRRRYKNT